MLHLSFPNISHKKAYEELMNEWKNHEEFHNWHISPWALFRGDTFEEFLQIAEDDRTDRNQWVPGTLFFVIEWDKILWGIQIRHSIDHPNLREFGGHIGYGIRPSERRKWYASEALKLALIEARELWLTRVMLGCFEDNIGSVRTIEKNGWVFERCTTAYEWKNSNIYWITVE